MDGARVYPTWYRLPHPDRTDGARYSGAILARDGERVSDLVAARGLGEKCDRPYSPPVRSLADKLASQRVRQRIPAYTQPVWSKPSLDDLHAVMYLCFLAVKSGVADAADVLGDTGVLHETLHFMVDDKYHHDFDEMVVDRVRHLENAVPGWFYEG